MSGCELPAHLVPLHTSSLFGLARLQVALCGLVPMTDMAVGNKLDQAEPGVRDNSVDSVSSFFCGLAERQGP